MANLLRVVGDAFGKLPGAGWQTMPIEDGQLGVEILAAFGNCLSPRFYHGELSAPKMANLLQLGLGQVGEGVSAALLRSSRPTMAIEDGQLGVEILAAFGNCLSPRFYQGELSAPKMANLLQLVLAKLPKAYPPRCCAAQGRPWRSKMANFTWKSWPPSASPQLTLPAEENCRRAKHGNRSV